MRILLFMSFLLTATGALGQMDINDIDDKKIIQRIQFIKTKTDSFLLAPFKKSVKSKFQFHFSSCGYFRGEFHSIYQFLNSAKPNPDDLNTSTHYYNFFDKIIKLKTDLGTWFYQDDGIKMQFQTTNDSLRFEALNKIYNKGLFNKIVAKIIELKLKNPFTVIQVDEKRRTFDVILKDKSLPHNFFIT